MFSFIKKIKRFIFRDEAVWFGMGIVASLLFTSVFTSISEYKYRGKGALGWYTETAEMNRRYIDLVTCSMNFNQCSYVIKECREAIESTSSLVPNL